MIDRRQFMVALGSFGLAPALLGNASNGETALPVELRGGRFFAVPRTLDGRTFACWLDTDGSGFIFDWAVNAFHLEVRKLGNGRRAAALPAFDPKTALPPIAGTFLSVFEESGADLEDPILKGFAAQLGGSWFERRVWRLDFRNARITVNAPPLTPAQATTALRLHRGIYPRLPVLVDGESIWMSFDIAASVAYRQASSFEGQEVSATSFVTRELFEAWHSAHPRWEVDRNLSSLRNVDRVFVPSVRIGSEKLENVAFTTRPRDDVFAGDDVRGKLGANAYGNRVVVIDYINGLLLLASESYGARKISA